jgi:GNAT superfamily N-acetyltransferase
MQSVQSPNDAAATLLADAFAADPVLTFLFAGKADGAHRRRALFDFFVADAVDRHVLDHGDGAAAIWHQLPPERLIESVRTLPDWVMAGCEARVGSVREAMQSAHPSEPHWYLFFIGSDVARIGQGLGARLLQVGLARADAMGWPCYLEATSPASARLYECHGFERRPVLPIAGGPDLYPMWRRPQS